LVYWHFIHCAKINFALGPYGLFNNQRRTTNVNQINTINNVSIGGQSSGGVAWICGLIYCHWPYWLR